jgi:hypothetical protein
VRLYRYIGPKQIIDRVRPELIGTPIRSPSDVETWIRTTAQELSAGCVIATYVIDVDGVFRIADRRSEHVACAAGGKVRSAGEVTFAIHHGVEVIAISNQSTGYCPEPESWPSVAAAISAAGFEPPDGFTFACHFRICPACGAKNLVKDSVFECGVCNADLPAAYNCQEPDTEHPSAIQ